MEEGGFGGDTYDDILCPGYYREIFLGKGLGPALAWNGRLALEAFLSRGRGRRVGGRQLWRMGRDSNPRYLAVHTLSRRAQSTALAPIRNEPTSLVSIARSCNPFVTLGTPGTWQNRFLDQDQKPCLVQTGGEPHWNCSAPRSGKGLSRESLKDLFAAAPCWCGTRDDSFNPSALKTSLHPRASHLSERQICHDSLASTCVRATTRNATPLPASLLASHLWREPLGDRL
jgi:hypothetical protein